MTIEHDISTNEKAKDNYLKGTYNENREGREITSNLRATNIKSSLYESLFLVFISGLVALVIGGVVGHAMGGANKWLISILQLLGASFLLWSVIWELGWKNRSFGGETLPERVHYWIFRGVSIFGSFLIFLSSGLSIV